MVIPHLYHWENSERTHSHIDNSHVYLPDLRVCLDVTGQETRFHPGFDTFQVFQTTRYILIFEKHKRTESCGNKNKSW